MGGGWGAVVVRDGWSSTLEVRRGREGDEPLRKVVGKTTLEQQTRVAPRPAVLFGAGLKCPACARSFLASPAVPGQLGVTCAAWGPAAPFDTHAEPDSNRHRRCTAESRGGGGGGRGRGVACFCGSENCEARFLCGGPRTPARIAHRSFRGRVWTAPAGVGWVRGEASAQGLRSATTWWADQ